MMNKFGKELGEYLEFYNISINEFASRIETTPKNLIDVIKGNISLSQNMIYNISFVTGIDVSYIENVERRFELTKNIDKYLEDNNLTTRQFINKFHYKELKDKYNLVYKNEKNDYSIIESILKYLRISNPETIYKDDNKIFYKSKNDKKELLALWLERCYKVIQNQKVKDYKKENINKIVSFIRKEAKNNRFNKNDLIKVFNENGIFLAIEDDLDGSKIRGAFKVLNNKPAIFITTKYKRYADIYFALLHELAHCKSDFNRAKNGSIISLYDDICNEDYEIRADRQALIWMVSDEDYKELLETNNVKVGIPCFNVYRLALDGKIKYQSSIYQENNKLIKE